MFSIADRFGTLVLAGALLFIALRLHKSTKHARFSKPAGVVLAFLAGCAFLMTIVGGWIGHLPATLVVAGLIVCVGIVVIDWGFDGKPDKAAFWAAALLAMFFVAGVSHWGQVTGQVGSGMQQVSVRMGGK